MRSTVDSNQGWTQLKIFLAKAKCEKRNEKFFWRKRNAKSEIAKKREIWRNAKSEFFFATNQQNKNQINSLQNVVKIINEQIVMKHEEHFKVLSSREVRNFNQELGSGSGGAVRRRREIFSIFYHYLLS